MIYGDELEVLRLKDNAKLPHRAHPDDAGLDLFSIENVNLEPGQTKLVKTGIAISIPKGYVGKIESRSSLAMLGVYVTGGIIDSGYTGQVKVIMNNLNASNDQDPVLLNEYFSIKAGDKIAQLILYPIAILKPVEVEELTSSERGEGGFGSSNGTET